MIEEFLSRHKNPTFFMSSGKDSAACFKLLKPYLHLLTVVWVNPGNPYPETVEYMSRVKAQCPNFLELTGDQPGFIQKYGYPVDVVPVQMMAAKVHFVPFSLCCRENLWSLMERHIIESGLTGIIRGQKFADSMRGLASGVWGNIEILHPIETWTDEEVFSFLGDDVPESYKRGLKSSLDCQTCTAYLVHNREHHLEFKNPEVLAVLAELKNLVGPVFAEL